MPTTRRAALAALMAAPLSAVTASTRQPMQLQEAPPPYADAREAAAGLPVLDGATLMLLEYARRGGRFDPGQMLRDLRQHAAEAWSSHRLGRLHGSASRGFVVDAVALDAALDRALGHRDFEARDQAADTWMALVGQREARLRDASRFLLPEGRQVLADYDSEHGGFAMRPDLRYSFGGGSTVGRLFLPLESSGHLYAALELPALGLPDGGPGPAGALTLPVASRARAREMLARTDLRLFYELSLRPGLEMRLRGDRSGRRVRTPVLSALLADLQAVVACDGQGTVLAYATPVQALRL